MLSKKLGASIAFVTCALTFLSAFDAEAACCHRHRRASCCTPCCDPCCGTIVEAAPCVTTTCCRNACGTVVVEEVVVSGCCFASAAPAKVTTTVASKAAPRPASGTAVTPVSVVRQSR